MGISPREVVGAFQAFDQFASGALGPGSSKPSPLHISVGLIYRFRIKNYLRDTCWAVVLSTTELHRG